MPDEKEPEPTPPYLAMFPLDIERWQSSGAYRRMSLAAQGAYLNLCFASWKAQPNCGLPDDDRDLWRLANAPSIEMWRAVKSEVFASDAWVLTDEWGWLNEVVLEQYMDSARRHAAAVRSGRIAGKASAKVRREAAKAARSKQHRTAVGKLVDPPLTQERSTTVDPPSLSLSLSQATNLSNRQEAADPLVDRAKWRTDWQRLLPFIAGREDLDPTEVAKKVTEYRGHSYVLFESIPDARLAHSMAALYAWERQLLGKPEAQAPKPAHPPPREPTTVGGRGMAAAQRFAARRGLNVGSSNSGDQIRGGADEVGRSLPPGSGRPDAGDVHGGDGGSGGPG